MKKIALLIGSKFSLLGTAGVIEIFQETNRVLAQMQDRNEALPIQIEYVGLTGEDQVVGNYGSIFSSCKTIDLDADYDLIIVPPIKAPLDENIPYALDFVPWIQNQVKKANTEICSFCTGSFLLAEAGLLEGGEATTHWFHAEEFRQRYPDVELKLKEIIIDRQGIYMSGGATAFLNMTLYLIEKYFGKDLSLTMSRLFLIEKNKESQAPYVMLSVMKNHNDAYVLQVQNIIEQEFTKVNIEELGDRIGLSSRSINRRFNKVLGISPVEYIKRVKLEVAKRALEQTQLTVLEVMYQSGYSDQKTFNYAFKNYTDFTPSEYRKRFYLTVTQVS